ncbi:Leucine-rich repeat and transmembrane domain-containing protein 1 [Camelus dromedarius]|uniref:Leucine-rich repeat and transmembrane domain-containing protein 1 n=1 Tax=Camelus dromedarius TaxID=9838 RepID=A0A5N4CYF8_CAMDR|nr:Leucine-rich repeat and transmembrane domain-containing protein 1 [Camelus dromedarius]
MSASKQVMGMLHITTAPALDVAHGVGKALSHDFAKADIKTGRNAPMRYKVWSHVEIIWQRKIDVNLGANLPGVRGATTVHRIEEKHKQDQKKVNEKLDPRLVDLQINKGGITDSVICVSPDTWKGKDLLKIPHELYQPCPFPSPDPESSQVQQLGATHRAVPRPPESHSAGEREHWECEIKPKPRPANLRHAVATIIITGVVCGIVCLMMLVAAIYGCTYAAITAQYHGGRLTQTNEPVKTEGKELFDSSPA